MPAEASTGAMLNPISEITMSSATAQMTSTTTEDSTAPTVRARCAWRWEASPVSSTQRGVPDSSLATTRAWVPAAIPRVTRRMIRRISAEAASAMTRMSRIREGAPSQKDQDVRSAGSIAREVSSSMAARYRASLPGSWLLSAHARGDLEECPGITAAPAAPRFADPFPS